MKNAVDALSWMYECQQSNESLWLFRGQSKIHPRIQPSLARLGEAARIVMYNVCRLFHVAAQGVTGYAIESELDRLGLLQHYVGLSPLLDLTGTPDVALYFALLGSSNGDECVVYALDTEAQTPEERPFLLTDHSFLALPLSGGGSQHRWLKQDGYGICPKGWPALPDVVTFDLLCVPGLRQFRFVRRDEDSQIVARLGDLERVEGDALAGRIRSVVNSILRELPSCPELDAKIAATRTIDPDALLRKQLQELAQFAATVNASERLQGTIEKLIQAERSNYWDTSFDASLDWVKRELTALN